MSAPRYCYVFEFEQIPDELYFIKRIDRKDNRYTAADPEYEPEVRVYEGA